MAGNDRQQSPDTKRTEQSILNWSFDEFYKVLAMMQLAYNPAEDKADRIVKVDAANIKFDPDTINPSYIGINTDTAASDGDADWLIFKITTTQILRKVGTWSGRVSLFS